MRVTALGVYGPYPKAGGHACSSYVVEYRDTTLVVDFGSGALTRLQEKFDVKKVDYICLTHFHYDHTSDLFPLVYLSEINGKKYDLVAVRDESIYAKSLINNVCFKYNEVDENTVFQAGDLKLRFFKMKHTVPTLAILVEGDVRVAFGGDTVYNDNIPEMLKESDVAFLDCSKPIGFKGPHMNVSNAREFAEAFPKTRIITTHFNPDYDPAPDLQGSAVEIAEEGRTYEFIK